ncbi:TRAP transporter permease [Chloroflexota bacterium]
MIQGKLLGYVQRVVAVSLVVYCFLYFSRIMFFLGIEPEHINYISHRAIFVAFVLTLTFLMFSAKKGAPRDKVPWYDIVLILIGLATCFYPVLFREAILEHVGRMEFTLYEHFFNWALILLIFEAVRRVIGLPLACIAGFFVIYPLICPWLPGPLHGRGYSLDRILMSMYIGKAEGVFGMIVGVAASIVMAFLIFANIMHATGAGKFFLELAFSLFGWTRGGPAKASVVASGLFGTIHGQGPANVIITGSVTIPVMIKTGYKPEVAGAVEVVASNGGHLMPPVMGAVAFIMAEWLGIPYGQVCIYALLPAILYYLGLLAQVDLIAAKENLRGMPRAELPSFWGTLRRGWGFLIPILVLIYLLMVVRYSPELSALWAIVAIILVTQIPKRTRLTPRQWLEDVFMHTGKMNCTMGCAVAAANVIMASIVMTGMTQRLTQVLYDIAGGNLLLMLGLVAIFCYLMGTGVGTIPIYVSVVLLAVPSLQALGVLPIAAHLFVYMMALTCFLTPPVCLLCFIASPIAGAHPYRIGWSAMKLAIVTYIVPFLFVYNPALLLIGSTGTVALAALTAIIGVIAIAAGVAGYLLTNLGWLERVLLLGAGIALIAPGWQTDIISLGILAVIVIWQITIQRRTKRLSQQI